MYAHGHDAEAILYERNNGFWICRDDVNARRFAMFNTRLQNAIALSYNIRVLGLAHQAHRT